THPVMRGNAMSIKSLLPFGRTTDMTQGGASDPFTAMRRDMDRLFEDFSRSMSLPAGFSGTGMLSPKVNASETKKGLEITAELPGIDEKDIDVDLDDGILTLKAEHKAEKEEKDEKKHYHLVERSSGTYMRRFALPFEPDEDRIEAKFEKGVLKIAIPRSAEAAKQAKKIAVKPA